MTLNLSSIYDLEKGWLNQEKRQQVLDIINNFGEQTVFTYDELKQIINIMWANYISQLLKDNLNYINNPENNLLFYDDWQYIYINERDISNGNLKNYINNKWWWKALISLLRGQFSLVEFIAPIEKYIAEYSKRSMNILSHQDIFYRDVWQILAHLEEMKNWWSNRVHIESKDKLLSHRDINKDPYEPADKKWLTIDDIEKGVDSLLYQKKLTKDSIQILTEISNYIGIDLKNDIQVSNEQIHLLYLAVKINILLAYDIWNVEWIQVIYKLVELIEEGNWLNKNKKKAA